MNRAIAEICNLSNRFKFLKKIAPLNLKGYLVNFKSTEPFNWTEIIIFTLKVLGSTKNDT